MAFGALKLLVFVAFCIAFGAMVMYNRAFLAWLDQATSKAEGKFFKKFGEKIRHKNIQLNRKSSLNKKSLSGFISKYFNEIIVNLDMTRDNVTPFGLLLFITSLAVSGGMMAVFYTGKVGMFFFIAPAVFYFFVILFRFWSYMRFESKEAAIMDAEDLISGSATNGVLNAIRMYQNSFSPLVKPHFDEFLDKLNRNTSFNDAMRALNDQLGPGFDDFATKAITYESKADNTMDDLFSQIVERNRIKRDIRYRLNVIFNELRLSFVVSTAIIGVYAIFSVVYDPFISNLLLKTYFGNILMVIDFVIIIAVLGYITAIKSKFL